MQLFIVNAKMFYLFLLTNSVRKINGCSEIWIFLLIYCPKLPKIPTRRINVSKCGLFANCIKTGIVKALGR